MTSTKFYHFIIFLCLTLQAFASSSPQPNSFKQWFTGPVLAPTPITMDPSHPGLELSLIIMNSYGRYNSHWKIENTTDLWSIIEFSDFQVGFNSFLGAELITSFTSNFKGNANSNRFQDTIFRLGFQVLNDIKGSWIPDFRVLIQETLPTGTYRKLNPSKKGTDSTGAGSFQTGIYLAFQKAFEIFDKRKCRLRWSAGYFVPAPTRVKGINTYGGGQKTNGKVYLGNYISAYLSGECEINRTWALAFDSNIQYNFQGRFGGKLGMSESGSSATISVPESMILSIAPEVEHTFSENIGIILGSWFSIKGKNTTAFSGVFLSCLIVF